MPDSSDGAGAGSGPGVCGPAFEQAKTLFLEGLACLQAGRDEEAEQRFLASLALLPGRVSTLINLAAVRLGLGRPAQALAAADEVLAAEPDNLDAWFHRSGALAQLGRHADALAACDRMLGLDSGLAEPWLRRGRALHALGRLEEALDSFGRALALDPGLAAAWIDRGSLLREQHRLDEAAAAFERALVLGADPELTGYYLAAVRASQARAQPQPQARAVPAAAPPGYVQALFDDYADEFDRHLVGLLRYRGPQLLAAPLAELGRGRREGGESGEGDSRLYASALDLGCGTGLCGPPVRPLAARLTGVDLSPRMLEKAAALGVYDRLEQAELLDHLRAAAAAGERHDLVIAADVFTYLGDLDPVFAAVRAVLEPGGVFCFSVELAGGGAGGSAEDAERARHGSADPDADAAAAVFAAAAAAASAAAPAPAPAPAPAGAPAGATDDTPAYVLLPSLRYAHSERYLLDLAARYDFDLVRSRRELLREDRRQAIGGLFVHLVRR